MDEMVLKTQEWLNKHYKGKHGYIEIDLTDESIKGRTGWTTIYALTRAFQIELGIPEPASNFGDGTTKKFKEVYPAGIQPAGEDATSNVYGIIQGALWCKGYSTGHYPGTFGELDTHFDESVASAVKQMKEDAGLLYPNGTVTLNVMKALLSMDYFVIGYGTGGDNGIRSIQQELNREYEDYIGLMPCDGVYGRNTNKALIYAIQAEEGLSVPGSGIGVEANGNFGPTTKDKCPTLPDTAGALTAEKEMRFTRILRHSLYCNGFGAFGANGLYDDQTQQTVKEFQEYYALSVTGVTDLGTWLSLLTSCGDPARPAAACDCATILTTAKAQTLKNEGYQVVGRYLSGTAAGGVSKALSDSEIQIIFNNGLRFFPISQGANNKESDFTEEKGKADAVSAYNAAKSFGLPYGTIIYFAVDFDAMDYQITNSIIPYFKGVYNAMLNESRGMRYKVGVYGARNVCSRVTEAGYACSSFVGDMSTGFSGNLGFTIPDNWAYDQFATVTVGSGAGQIEIDKDGYSRRDPGVSNVSYLDQYSYTKVNPTVYMNRWAPIPVYSKKNGPEKKVDGEIIGYIQMNQFYTRYRTGYTYFDPNYEENDGYRWILDGDYVHAVIFTDAQGRQRWGFIQENDLAPEDYNYIDSSLPFQEPFHEYNFDGEEYVDSHKVDGAEPDDDPFYIFTVKKPARYFNSEGNYLGTLQPGTSLLTGGSSGGLEMGWCMWFDKMRLEGEFAYYDIDQQKLTGAYVELGYNDGSLGESRTIW